MAVPREDQHNHLHLWTLPWLKDFFDPRHFPSIKAKANVDWDVGLYPSSELLNKDNFDMFGHTFDFIVNSFIPIIIGIGLLGNLTSIAIFLSYNLSKYPFTYYFTALLCTQSFCLLTMLLALLDTAYEVPIYKIIGACQGVLYFSAVSNILSFWFLMIGSHVCYTNVKYPHRSVVSGIKQAKKTIFYLVCFVAVVYSLILFDINVEYFESIEVMGFPIFKWVSAIFSFIVPSLAIIRWNTLSLMKMWEFRTHGRLKRLAGPKQVARRRRRSMLTNSKENTATIEDLQRMKSQGDSLIPRNIGPCVGKLPCGTTMTSDSEYVPMRPMRRNVGSSMTSNSDEEHKRLLRFNIGAPMTCYSFEVPTMPARCNDGTTMTFYSDGVPMKTRNVDTPMTSNSDEERMRLKRFNMGGPMTSTYEVPTCSAKRIVGIPMASYSDEEPTSSARRDVNTTPMNSYSDEEPTRSPIRNLGTAMTSYSDDELMRPIRRNLGTPMTSNLYEVPRRSPRRNVGILAAPIGTALLKSSNPLKLKQNQDNDGRYSSEHGHVVLTYENFFKLQRMKPEENQKRRRENDSTDESGKSDNINVRHDWKRKKHISTVETLEDYEVKAKKTGEENRENTFNVESTQINETDEDQVANQVVRFNPRKDFMTYQPDIETEILSDSPRTRHKKDLFEGAKMMVIISIIYYICTIPCYLLRLYNYANYEYWSLEVPASLWCGEQVLMVLNYSKFSFNFMLFYIFSKSFRDCIWEGGN